MGYYSIKDYVNDVQEANDLYERIVVDSCCDMYGRVEARSDEEIYTIKNQARAARNQYLGAAGKRLRVSVAMRMLDALEVNGWDMTATLAVNVTKALLGRAIDRNKLIAKYSSSGRTAADKSKSFEKLKKLNEDPIFIGYQNELSCLLEQALNIRKKHAPSLEGSAFDTIKKSAELYLVMCR